MKRFLALLLCVLLTVPLTLSAVSSAEAADAAATAETPAETPTYYSHGGRVTLIDGACVDTPITGFEDAVAVVAAVLDQLGGDGRTELEPWRELTDAFGNRYYVFQQMLDDTTVLGGAVKVITDGSGRMLGLTSSIVSDLPEPRAGEDITPEAAEQIVLDYAMETRQQALTLQEGLTDRMILPTILSLDVESDDDVGGRYVWVVYTDNPDSSLERSSDLPYLAHYVTTSGEYLYSLPTIMPGDEAATSGFDASYVFEFMEPVDYTGYVDLSTGEEMEISVTVMRDKRTGMYYLGNLERRIVVGDCWEFLYNGNRVVLEASPDNLEWDQVGLLTLYNYCRAYDYYKAIGWEGGDGLGTPILVLNNYCDIDHTPVDNAAYVGNYLGWQLFLASQGNDYSQCLDVLGHEYTHCVTGSVMTYNAYMNDYGAINEAMSDIQGKTCQMLAEGAENVTWELADKSTAHMRSMSEPHWGNQPEFTWDVYYIPNVKTPTTLNDRGGVHTNSSLLNQFAWRLYEKGGMTPEEGRAFWFTVDCAMVPGTDYPQLAELLPWALRAAGLEQYDTELRRALDATRLGVDEVPNVFDEDRALLTLTLPDNAIFDDGQWAMQIFTVDVEKLIESAKDIVTHVMLGDYSVLPPSVQAVLEPEPAEGQADEEEESWLEMMLDALLSEDDAEALSEEAAAQGDAEEGPFDNIRGELMEWARERFDGVFYMATISAGQDGRTMRVVNKPGFALPLLLHGVYNENTSSLEDVYCFLYLGDRWIDFSRVQQDIQEMKDNGGDADNDLQAVVNRLIDGLGDIHSYDDALELLFYHVRGGESNVIPATGLETADPRRIELDQEKKEDAEIPQPRKSRPKLDEVPDAA